MRIFLVAAAAAVAALWVPGASHTDACFPRHFYDPAVSPNSQWVAYGTWTCHAETTALGFVSTNGRWGPARIGLRPAAWDWAPRGAKLAAIVGLERKLVVWRPGKPMLAIAEDVGSFRWSPTGRRIAFTVIPSRSLFVALPGAPRLLARYDVDILHKQGFDWSPSGRRIAFARTTRSVVQVISAAGGIPTTITTGFRPDWSPDGRWIAVSRMRSVALAHPNGSRGREVRGKCDYVWSPTGRQIALLDVCVGASVPAKPSVAVARPDGSRARLVGRGWPVWSPTGSRVALVWPAPKVASSQGGSQLRVVRRNGRGSRSIDPLGTQPQWSPDGSRILFTHSAGLRSSVQVARATGRGRQRLSFGHDGDWADKGKAIVFVRPGCGEELVVLKVHDRRRSRRLIPCAP